MIREQKKKEGQKRVEEKSYILINKDFYEVPEIGYLLKLPHGADMVLFYQHLYGRRVKLHKKLVGYHEMDASRWSKEIVDSALDWLCKLHLVGKVTVDGVLYIDVYDSKVMR